MAKQIKKSSDERETKAPSTLQKLRGSHTVRIWAILVLMAIVGVLFVFYAKFRIALAVIFITLLAALGLEVSQNDWDLGRMLQTGSVKESKVARDARGDILFDKYGDITTDKSKGKESNDYNCDDFSTRPEAQSFFTKVGGTKNDVNRLDGNNNGDACESLPNGN